MTKTQKYYLGQFKKIDEGKFSWNWSACLLSFYWALYRKLYSGVFYTLLYVIFTTAFAAYLGEDLFNITVPTIFLLYFFIWGAFGNRLYYSVVKKRIKKGYHRYDKYKSTSRFLLFSLIALDVVNVLLSVFFTDCQFQVLSFIGKLCQAAWINLPLGFYLMDKWAVAKLNKENKDFSHEINEDSILRMI